MAEWADRIEYLPLRWSAATSFHSGAATVGRRRDVVAQGFEDPEVDHYPAAAYAEVAGILKKVNASTATAGMKAAVVFAILYSRVRWRPRPTSS